LRLYRLLRRRAECHGSQKNNDHCPVLHNPLARELSISRR
jgi:hypothetical protein